MKLPRVRGVIDRRVLVNYHADPSVVARLLPAPFRPQIHAGAALVGICLIRVKAERPDFAPAWMGITSENAAHRTAVEWDEGHAVRQGVYIRRRDTNSWMTSLAGGRVFPGVQHHARFMVEEAPDRFAIALESDDGTTRLSVRGRRAEVLPTASVFGSLDEASAFFRGGSLGYSATPDPSRFHGLELQCRTWDVEPVEIDEVRSSVFEDPAQFPPGSIAFDCALLMKGIEHQWVGRDDLCGPGTQA